MKKTVVLTALWAALNLLGCGSGGSDRSTTSTSSTSTVPPPGPPAPAPGPPLPSCDSPQVFGVLRYWEQEHGDMTAKAAYVIKGFEGGACKDGSCVTISDGGNKLIFQPRTKEQMGARIHLSSTCPQSDRSEPEHLIQWNLIGKSIRYNVDLSGLDCGCMAGIYLTGMPNYDSSCAWGYCDAIMGQRCDANCQEMDMLKGNSRFILSNPQASEAGRKHKDWPAVCRQWPNAKKYGVGKDIDSSNLINVITTFHNDVKDDEISKIETVLTSGNDQVFMLQKFTDETSSCNATTALNDLTFKMSTSGMVLNLVNQEWIDDQQVDECDGSSQCNLGGFSISDIEIFPADGDLPSEIIRAIF